MGLLFFGLGIFVYKNNFAKEIPCLEEIARDYCEEKGFYFERILFWIRWAFYCEEDLRQSSYHQYKFLEGEIEECKK